MKNIMFCIGLPRSGSTLLMNILNENPEIYTTGTCPLPYTFEGMQHSCQSISEFVAMDMDVLDKSVCSFLKHGVNGWFQAQTHKQNVISKSRVWDQQLRFLFKIYKNPKFIVCLRDPRDIIVSFEKLLQKYPHLIVGDTNDRFERNSFDKRIEMYCTETQANLGRSLSLMSHVHEYILKYPSSFFLFKWEQFNQKPIESLKSLYEWMELPNYNHDLNNIPPSDYIEHDTVYRSMVSHKTRPKFEPLISEWPKYFNSYQNNLILTNLKWFYEIFYPEMLPCNLK